MLILTVRKVLSLSLSQNSELSLSRKWEEEENRSCDQIVTAIARGLKDTLAGYSSGPHEREREVGPAEGGLKKVLIDNGTELYL